MKCDRCGTTIEEREYAHPNLLICEGASDAAFFRELLRARGRNDVHVRATRDLGTFQGNTAFASALRGARVVRGFENIRRIVIATDNDDDQSTSFLAVKSQIDDLVSGPDSLPDFCAPTQPFTSTTGPVSLAIMMVPTDSNTGTLESLLFAAAETMNSKNSAAVQALATIAGVDSWKPQKQAKMKVRSFLACTHESAPDVPVGQIWIKPSSAKLIPVTCSVFDALFLTLSTLFPSM